MEKEQRDGDYENPGITRIKLASDIFIKPVLIKHGL